MRVQRFIQLFEAYDVGQEYLYHAAPLPKIAAIVVEDQFRLGHAFLKGSDAQHNDPERPYFLSCSYDPDNVYRQPGQDTLVLNHSRLLQAGLQTREVDYWGNKDYDEKEVRLSSAEPVLANARQFIEEIHLLIHEHPQSQSAIAHILESGIPTFCYQDRQALYSLDKSQAVDCAGQAHEDYTFKDARPREYEHKELEHIHRFLHFLETGESRKKQFGPEFGLGMDLPNTISNMMHRIYHLSPSPEKDETVQRMWRIMQDYGATTATEMTELVRQRWG